MVAYYLDWLMNLKVFLKIIRLLFIYINSDLFITNLTILVYLNTLVLDDLLLLLHILYQILILALKRKGRVIAINVL